MVAGRALLETLPYNHDAVACAGTHFDDSCRARGAPRSIPTLIVTGAEDRVVDQHLWRDEPGFHRPNMAHRRIDRAGYFPWIDNLDAVGAAFAELIDQIDPSSTLSR